MTPDCYTKSFSKLDLCTGYNPSVKRIIEKMKIPNWNEIAPVYAVITLIVYGWTLYWTIHELPAWLNYLQLGEVINLYFYFLMTNFLESLLILIFIVGLCIVLPRSWLLDDFIYRGTALSLFITTYLTAMIIRRSQILEFSTNMVKWFPVILGIALLFIVIFEKLPFIKKLVEGFADRATVFLYINIPVSILAILVVITQAIKK